MNTLMMMLFKTTLFKCTLLSSRIPIIRWEIFLEKTCFNYDLNCKSQSIEKHQNYTQRELTGGGGLVIIFCLFLEPFSLNILYYRVNWETFINCVFSSSVKRSIFCSSVKPQPTPPNHDSARK